MPIVVTGRHRPHEALFLAFSAVSGVAFVLGGRPPNTLQQLLPGWLLWTWYLLLLASGLIGLVSITLSDLYRALVLERAAMVGQMAAPALYGIGLAATGQTSAVFASAACLTWTAASAWRGWQVHQGIRALRQAGDEQ